MKPDQLRVHTLLKDTVTLLCKNGLNFHNVLRIQGVIGITVDDVDVFLVHINDVFGIPTDSAGDEEMTAPKSPQKTDTEACKKSVKSQVRSSFTEQQSCLHRQAEEDTVHTSQQVDDSSMSFPVEQASKADVSSCFYSSANAFAAPASNSGSSFDFPQAKKEPKQEEHNDDDVVFLPPEDLPLDGFSQGCYMEQTQAEANLVKCKRDRHQYDAYDRELRKQNQTKRRQIVTNKKTSPVHMQEQEHNDLADFSSQQAHQQATMLQSSRSYNTSVDCELSSFVNNSYSTHSVAVDYNSSTGDVVADPTDNSQWSYFGELNGASEENQNLLTLDVQQRSFRHVVSDQAQRKKRPGRPSQQVPGDCWATVTATKFLCKMCGSSFNHRPSLLAHQINKHGRQKNKRGRPPTRLYMERTYSL